MEILGDSKLRRHSNENIETSIKNKQKISSYMKFYLLKKNNWQDVLNCILTDDHGSS